MDYEKKYKAILETATKWIEDGCTDKERICLESVFPELCESEDEKINKAIQKYLDWLTAYPIYAPRGEYSIRDMLHYLYNLERKQKEQKQEQKEVDLEKEIIRYQREDMDRDTTVGDVARHFYKLGLKAREDEQ